MKKLAYTMLALLVAGISLADDHIIQFVLKNGNHVSFRASEIQRIRYEYHDQDSIDKAYADSVAHEKHTKSLHLTADDGTDVVFNLSRSLQLTFADNLLVADDGEQRVEVSLDLVHLAYSTEVAETSVESAQTADQRPAVKDNTLVFTGLAHDQQVKVYTVNGRLISTQTAKKGTVMVRLTDLPKGVCIIQTGSYTFKYQRH